MSETTTQEVATQSSVQSSPESAPQSTVSAAVETGKGASVSGSPQSVATEAGQAPQYQPNFKFKVLDQEKEFDEFVRGVIKDSDTEKKVRELYEKAYGLDVVKPKLHKTREELEAVRGEWTPIKESIEVLKTHVKNKDFDAFFKDLNIPEHMIMQWAVQKAQYNDLSPQDKQRYDSEIELRRRNSELERELSSTSSKASEASVNLKRMELDYSLQNPEVNQIMRDYDAQKGQVGAFRDEVIRYGIAMEASSGKDVSAKEAVEALLGLMGRVPGRSSGQMSPQPQSPETIQVPTKPVIPNLKSRSGVPVKKSPQSFDELRAQNMERIKQMQQGQ